MPETDTNSNNERAARRKIRKGTVSCWECKRRKVRCRFEGPQTAICIPCKSRGAVCVTQEHPDTGRTPQLGDRLNRVETLLGEVLERLGTGGLASPAPREVGITQEYEYGSEARGVTGRSQVRLGQDETNLFQTAGEQAVSPRHATWSGSESLGHPTALSRALLLVLPIDRTLRMILSEPFDTPSSLYGFPSSSSTLSEVVSTSPWQAPSPELHPVLVAKSLLLFCCCLQGMRPDRVIRLGHAGIDCAGINSQIVNTIQDLVLFKDDLMRSVDGIECLLLESMYHNNAGDLKQAWLSTRRALAAAQMMRLHRSPRTVPNSYLWFRLLKQDRYLSLMLDLPDGAADAHHVATPETLALCSATERLERLDTLAAGRMLQRTTADARNIDLTAEIDSILQDATGSMPSKWWLLPNSFDVDDPSFGNGIVRLMHQLAHFHLVARLHLPYLLHSSKEASHEQCRYVAMNASREILARYVAFRRSTASKGYCRGIDFIMFIACTTLCLSHVNHTLQGLTCGTSHQFSCLAHQRPTDRGLMESALDILALDQVDGDDITSRLTRILMHLLKSEADAAAGTAFVTSTSTDTEQECCGKVDDSGRILRISIPWIGTVTFERIAVSSAQSQMCPEVVVPEYLNVATMDTDLSFEGGDIWPLQDVDAALFSDIFQGLGTSFSA